MLLLRQLSTVQRFSFRSLFGASAISQTGQSSILEFHFGGGKGQFMPKSLVRQTHQYLASGGFLSLLDEYLHDSLSYAWSKLDFARRAFHATSRIDGCRGAIGIQLLR
jgi:hypothetical protein